MAHQNLDPTTLLSESVFEIGMAAAFLITEKEIEIKDSRDLFSVALVWAGEFERDWQSDTGEDYYIAIWEFAREKLLSMFKVDSDRATAIVLVEGGLVREIRSNLPTLRVLILDVDTDHPDAEEEKRRNYIVERSKAPDMVTVY